MGRPSASAGWALALLVALASPLCRAATPVLKGSRFPSRYQTQPCSLFGVEDDNHFRGCEIRSIQEQDSGREGFLKLNHGEANCTVVLTNCAKNVCYTLRDMTSTVRQDAVPHRLPSSFFADFKILEGANGKTFTKDGFAFRAKAKRVVIQYSTATCAEYYSYRGREVEFCNLPVEAATQLTAELAIGLECGLG